MRWTCPACQNEIHHAEAEAAPRYGVTYRCFVCRLELVVDPERRVLTLAPMSALENRADKRGAKSP